MHEHKLKTHWDASYARRVSLNEVIDVLPGAGGSRMLEVGCGIGRDLVFGTEMGFDMHGVGLSGNAVQIARAWLQKKTGAANQEKIIAGDASALPWQSDYFAHSISDSALDSMPFSLAQKVVAEVVRLVRPEGYFYCNLISGDETGRDPNFCGGVLSVEPD